MKMLSSKGLIFMTVAWILLILGAYTIYIIQHENSHRQIFTYHGLANSTIEYHTFGIYYIGGTTTASCDYLIVHEDTYDCVIQNKTVSTITHESFRNMMALHGLNEVIGYHVGALIIAFFLGLAYITLLIFWMDR